MDEVSVTKILLIDASITQSILVVLYLATIIRMLCTSRLNFLIFINILLALSCVTWVIICYLRYQLTIISINETGYCSDLTQPILSKCRKMLAWFGILTFFNLICYNYAIWLFAMRYWALSKTLVNVMNQKTQHKIFNPYNVTICGLVFISIVSLLSTWLNFHKEKHPHLYALYQFVLWTFSFSFLADGLRRIKQ